MGSAAASPDRAKLVAAAGRIIREGSRSFHAASRLFDRTTRERAWLLYTWCRHCDDVCDGQELGRRSKRRERPEDFQALTRLTLAGSLPRDIPYQALAVVLEECAIPHSYVTDHLDGFALDAAGWRPEDEEGLITYCYHVAGVVGCMMAIVMGVDRDDESTLASASAMGIAFQLSNIARDLCEDEKAGRCYVPASWLREHDLDPAEPLPIDDRDRLAALAARLLLLADRYEQAALPGVAMLPFRARWAVIAAARIYGDIGRRVAALGPAAWDRRVVVGRGAKLGFLMSSLVDTLRTRKGRNGSLRIHRSPAARPLPPAVTYRRRADGAGPQGDFRPSS